MKRRFDQLSPRHRDVLRAAYRGFSTDEIADQLGIKRGTVASYIAEAITILAARNRREAARLLYDHEGVAPAKDGGQNHGVDSPPLTSPSPSPVDQRASLWGPLSPANWGKDNDLGITARLAWIVILVFIAALGFALIAATAHFFSLLVQQGRAGG